MANENLNPLFQQILAPFMPSASKINIGDRVNSPHGESTITGIEIPAPGKSDGGIELTYIWTAYKDICVFELANGHWAYGSDITLI